MARAGQVLSHWYNLAPNFQTSALDFYKAVELELARQAVPEIQFGRIDWKESGVLTAKREYLRVARGRLSFDICAAPFGNAYFFSWWLAEQLPEQAAAYGGMGLVAFVMLLYAMVAGLGLTGLILSPVAIAAVLWFIANTTPAENLILEDIVICTPVIRDIYRRAFKPVTYFSRDTTLMFQETVRNAVLTVIGDLRSAQGLRALAPEESQPKLRLLAGME